LTHRVRAGERSSLTTSKRLDDIEHRLARAVFASVYRSRGQRLLRLAAWLVILAKHTLRGLLFSWPVYVMSVAGFYTDSPVNWLLWALGVPGIGISLYILARGVREDYRVRVRDQLLRRDTLLALLKANPSV
jgi:hypothetical protein